MLRKILNKIRRYRFRKEVISSWQDEHLLSNYYKKEYDKYTKKGFSPSVYLIYDLKHNDYHNYLSAFDRCLMRKVNGNYSIILDDRRIFYKILGDKVFHPEVLFTKLGSNFYDKNNVLIEKEEIIEYLKEHKGLFYNRMNGGDGKGAFSLKLANGKLLIDNKEESSIDLDKLSDGTFTNLLIQRDFENNINPHSLNTIRVITINDNGNFSSPFASHRFGTKLSGSKDNLCGGGIACVIDLETGKMSVAKSVFTGLSYSKHPDTMAQIEGEVVPKIKEVLAKAISLHKTMPYLKFIAWDFAVLENDQLCVIEANASSSTNILQLEKGQRYEPLGLFLEKYNAIFK